MPLRLRLSLWYGTALALILVAFSTVLYFVTARSLRDALDQSLEETAAAAVRSLEERGFLPLIDEDELMSQFPELARIDKFFQIFSPSGTITIRSPNVKQHELPLSRRALEVAFSGQTIFESAKYPKEPPLRLISVPIIYRGNLLYIVQVGTSMESVDQTLNRLLLVLLVTMPLALAVSLAGGWFLAGRALRPVDAITLAAQRIAGGDLTQRLVDNAVKYSRPGGTVDISLGTQGNQARFTISDEGIGISHEDQKRIFDRFYRTDDARTHAKKGTGLGLAICAWIAESHQGRIEVESEPNKGSTFTVVLPLAPPSS
jgi:sensor histidine kinase regulating citrate/malate metabolism